MKIAVIFCSRGLAFSQTCDELLENLEGFTYDLFFSHNVDGPERHKKPLKQALYGSYTHFWLVDEDIVLPKDILATMVKELEGDAIKSKCPNDGMCLLTTRRYQKSPKKYSVEICSVNCGKRVLVQLGKSGTNKGEHNIKLLTSVA